MFADWFNVVMAMYDSSEMAVTEIGSCLLESLVPWV